MKTSSLHNLVVGTPIISATYEQLQKSYFLPLSVISQLQLQHSKIFFLFTDKAQIFNTVYSLSQESKN